MTFINRESEITSFRSDYISNTQNKISQIYIIEADHGIGKSEFIREVSKYFSYYPLEIFQSDDTDELSIFKNLVLELDKNSEEYGYNDFKTFYSRKANNAKAVQLLLKITAIFGQALARLKNYDFNLETLAYDPVLYEDFILNAQIENLFEYAKYAFSSVNIHIIFHDASNIDLSSLNMLCMLIKVSGNNVFIFESDNDKSSSKIEQCLQNSHTIFLKKYQLNRLSDEHIHKYIQQLLRKLKLQADRFDSSILKESIEKGDLAEIASIIKDYNDRLKKDTYAQIRSIKEILASLSDTQSILLILASYANGKLSLPELKDIIDELNSPFVNSDVDYLFEKNLIKNNNEYISLMPFVYQVLNSNDFRPILKYATASALIKNLNTRLIYCFNSRYVDILVEYYLNCKDFLQLKSMLPIIDHRLKCFNTQAERIDYFRKFEVVLQELHDNDTAIKFAQIAYDANLYSEALDFINLADDNDDDTIFIKALILNRCEDFEQSRKYIEFNRTRVNKRSSINFKLSLVLMMNLIQLDEFETAYKIFEELKPFAEEPLYPYLIRLSNVFCQTFDERLAVVQSITESFYQSNDDEFCGLHAVYLAYLYALTQQPEQAENSLATARDFFGNNVIYNHMILHNEATIRFLNHEINEEIPALLGSAKITAYDEYDRFAINNNLLCYYILNDKISSLECQEIVMELERMLHHTYFKRFINKIYYNLYYYYMKMYNSTKSEYYRTKLLAANIKYDENYTYKLMYETSWKLPITIKCSDA